MPPATLAAPAQLADAAAPTAVSGRVPGGTVVSRRLFTQASLGAGVLAAAVFGSGAQPAAAATVAASATVQHGTNPNVARPNATIVTWVGTVRPVGAQDNDRWYLA